MSGPARQAGRFVDDAGRTVTWSMAEGRRGRRWRWAVADRTATAIVAHTLELDPTGGFSRLESASGTGLLTLHREADGSIHGNRVTERGGDHLWIPAPAPERALVGSGPLGAVALVTNLEVGDGGATFEVLEVSDDLGVQVTGCSVDRRDRGAWEVKTDLGVRRADVTAAGLPHRMGATWPLEEV